MQNRQRVTKTKKNPSKAVAVSEGGSVSSALLVMVNCCTQAPVLKQESLCQEVHGVLENRWCGSELIRGGCPAAFVCCQKSQAKLPLLFHSHLQRGRSSPNSPAEEMCRASSSRELWELAWAAQRCGADISFGCNNNRKMRYIVFRGFGATGC